MSERPVETIVAELGRLTLRHHRARIYAALTEGVEGVDETTYPVLSGLGRTGPTTVTELSAAVGLYRSVTTRHADRLATDGLIQRGPHPTDRRATVLSLTDAGTAALHRMRSNFTALVSEATATWDDTEVAAFAAHFRQLLSALEALGVDAAQGSTDDGARRS